MSSSSSSPSVLQSLIYTPATAASAASLQVLDQLRLPQETVYLPVPDLTAAWTVIHTMQIRGAPLIAIVAVLGLTVELQSEACVTKVAQLIATSSSDSAAEQKTAVAAYLQTKMEYIATSRPTAVNLFNALAELKDAVARVQADDALTATDMIQAVADHAEYMLRRDEADCRAIGGHGATAIWVDHTKKNSNGSEGATVMTICNTGSLATAAYGTALGVVRSLHANGQLQSVVALETRPYNQGSRLTCFECLTDQLPGATLVCDSMAGAYMAQHNVSACVVGADRVAANGDTANKIGTYNLALVAHAHGVPFYVAAPFTTLDVTLETGAAIPIEERPAKELLASANAPSDMPVWNPAFDVTPAKYIAGIVTEKGVIRPDLNGAFDCKAFVAMHTTSSEDKLVESIASKLQVPADYTEQSVSSLPAYLAQHVPKALMVLNATSASDLECVEMGDGNLNLVFIVSNTNDPNGTKVIVKQALPYVRCVGESWPLTLERAYFEYTALEAEKTACPAFVPDLYYFSKDNALIVMEYLAPPNIILRKGLIQGIRYPTMAADMGTFCANTLFKTSGFALDTTEFRTKVQFWSRNVEMCKLTEQVVFTEPYIVADNNRWTTPQLDDEKIQIENDVALKEAAAGWKEKFVTQTQALIHADLHSGSVMCSPEDHKTFVIDPEFAFYGPAGFDTGAFIANLFLSYVSQEGHREQEDGYAEWILQQIQIFWQTFAQQFTALWSDEKEHTGFLYGRELFADQSETNQTKYVKELLAETLGFAGMKMLRRIVGIAHVEDLDSIEDADKRAKCEKRGLTIAKAFIKTAGSFDGIEDAIQLARSTS